MADKDDRIIEYTLLAFMMVLIGWLVYEHTGNEAHQLSPDFWAGGAWVMLGQLIKKTFDLKKKE